MRESLSLIHVQRVPARKTPVTLSEMTILDNFQRLKKKQDLNPEQPHKKSNNKLTTGMPHCYKHLTVSLPPVFIRKPPLKVHIHPKCIAFGAQEI